MRATIITIACALLVGCPPPTDDESDGPAPAILWCDKYYGPDVPMRRCVCDESGRCLDMA